MNEHDKDALKEAYRLLDSISDQGLNYLSDKYDWDDVVPKMFTLLGDAIDNL